MPFIGQTKETLSFEHEVLAGLMDGFGGNATKVVAVTIPAFDSKEVTVAVPKARAAKVVAPAAGASVDVKVDAKADAKADAKGPAGKATGKGAADVKAGGKAPAVKPAPDKKPTDKGDAKGKVDHKEGPTASNK